MKRSAKDFEKRMKEDSEPDQATVEDEELRDHNADVRNIGMLGSQAAARIVVSDLAEWMLLNEDWFNTHVGVRKVDTAISRILMIMDHPSRGK